MVEYIDVKCPDCGSELLLPKHLEKAFCMYCGNEIMIIKTEFHITGGVIPCPICGGYGIKLCPKCAIHYVTLLQLYNKGIGGNPPKEGACIECDGNGTITSDSGSDKCPKCQGTGNCDICKGEGKVKCNLCDGSGEM